MSGIRWEQDAVAGVQLRRFVGRIGAIEVGNVTFDGGNRFWVWASPLQEDAWGYGPSEDAAKAGLEHWLTAWLENFRPFLEYKV